MTTPDPILSQNVETRQSENAGDTTRAADTNNNAGERCTTPLVTTSDAPQSSGQRGRPHDRHNPGSDPRTMVSTPDRRTKVTGLSQSTPAPPTGVDAPPHNQAPRAAHNTWVVLCDGVLMDVSTSREESEEFVRALDAVNEVVGRYMFIEIRNDYFTAS